MTYTVVVHEISHAGAPAVVCCKYPLISGILDDIGEENPDLQPHEQLEINKKELIRTTIPRIKGHELKGELETSVWIAWKHTSLKTDFSKMAPVHQKRLIEPLEEQYGGPNEPSVVVVVREKIPWTPGPFFWGFVVFVLIMILGNAMESNDRRY